MSKTRLIANVSLAAILCAAVSFPLHAAQQADGIVTKIEVGGFAPDIKARLETALTPFIGRTMSDDLRHEIHAAILPIENHIGAVEQRDAANGNVTLKVLKTPVPQRIGADLGTAFPPDPSQRRIAVAPSVIQQNLIHQPDPVYPPLARQARIQGTVKFQVLISTEGNVQGLQLISGHPLLVQAAQEAVRQSTYRPTLLNGEPVQVVTTVDVPFHL